MRYKEIEKIAQRHDKTILATDKRLQNFVYVEIDDGSFFKWLDSFAVEYDDWYIVFTEHYGFHIFGKSDIVNIVQADKKTNIWVMPTTSLIKPEDKVPFYKIDEEPLKASELKGVL